MAFSMVAGKAFPSYTQAFTVHTRCFWIIATVASMAWYVTCDNIGFNVLVYITRRSVMPQNVETVSPGSSQLLSQAPEPEELLWCKGTADLRTEVRTMG